MDRVEDTGSTEVHVKTTCSNKDKYLNDASKSLNEIKVI